MLNLVRATVDLMCSIQQRRRVHLLILIWALLFGGLIALDALFLRDVLDTSFGEVLDISYYRYRTESVLDGLWLYRDIPCESPPLIVYLMIPAQLANGGNLAYQVWFSIFVLLTSLTFYLALRRYDDTKAFLAALVFMFVPVGTVETVFGIQDEAIVIWLFVLSIFLGVIGMLRWSALATTIGIWTKLINALYFPFLLRAGRGGREKMLLFGIVVGLSLAVALPFLILFPEDFLRFPLYYFLSSGSEALPTGGLSIWDFLRMGGLDLPSWFFLALIVSALVLAYYFGLKRERTLLEGMLIVLTAFVIVYSRSAAGYFMLPISLLLLWGVEDLRLVVRCMVLYVPLILSGLFSTNNAYREPFVDWEWGWAVGAILQLIVILILLDATRVALGRKNFVDRAIARELGESGR
jgi:hypothetical protein